MDVERDTALLALVDRLQPLLGGGVAVFTVLAMRLFKFIKNPDNHVVDLIVSEVVGDGQGVWPDRRRSVCLEHLQAQLPQKVQVGLMVAPDGLPEPPGIDCART